MQKRKRLGKARRLAVEVVAAFMELMHARERGNADAVRAAVARLSDLGVIVRFGARSIDAEEAQNAD